jgi:hypothetical protein
MRTVIAAGGCMCPGCKQLRRIADESANPAAIQVAERLLAGYLTKPQLEDWCEHGAFNVRGSVGRLWRVSPGYMPDHHGMLCENGEGVSVWPVGIGIDADAALSMLLYLEADEVLVSRSGCHEWCHQGRVPGLHDYDGTL